MIRHRALVTALFAVLIASVRPAFAQTPPTPLPVAPAPMAPMPAPSGIEPLEPRSMAMMVAGIAMSATGGALLHAASLYPALHRNDGSNVRGITGGLLGAGVALIVVGVPLLIVGGRHVRPPPPSRATVSSGGLLLRF